MIKNYVLYRCDSGPRLSAGLWCSSGLFCLLLLSFRLVPVYSGTILVYSVSFRCHLVLFQSHSALFWHIPVYSVPSQCLATPCYFHSKYYCSFSDGYTCQIFLMTEVLQLLQKAKTHAIPLGNHVTQQKLTENRSVLTKTPNFGIFTFILLYSGLFGCHSMPHSGIILVRSSIFRYQPCSVCSIPVSIPPHSGIFWYIPFRSVPVFINSRCVSLWHLKMQAWV